MWFSQYLWIYLHTNSDNFPGHLLHNGRCFYMDSHCCVYTGNLGTYLITLSEFCIDKEIENTNHKEHNKPRYLNCGFLSCDTMHSHKKRPNFGELATFIFRVKVNVLRLCQKTASYCKTMASTYKITLCDNLDNHNLNAKSYIHMLCYNKTGTKHKKCRQFCYHFCLLYVLCTCRNHYQMYNTLKLYIQQNKANTSRLRNQKSDRKSGFGNNSVMGSRHPAASQKQS